MGYVAVTIGFAALGAYLGRGLSGELGLALLIGAIAVIVGLNIVFNVFLLVLDLFGGRRD
jgi:hypothetical protein